jgi:hypothetical protein
MTGALYRPSKHCKKLLSTASFEAVEPRFGKLHVAPNLFRGFTVNIKPHDQFSLGGGKFR